MLILHTEIAWKKILSMVDKIASFRVLRIKSNTQDWFNDEVTKTIKLREKRLQQFKSTKLHIDEDFIKKLNIVQ